MRTLEKLASNGVADPVTVIISSESLVFVGRASGKVAIYFSFSSSASTKSLVLCKRSSEAVKQLVFVPSESENERDGTLYAAIGDVGVKAWKLSTVRRDEDAHNGFVPSSELSSYTLYKHTYDTCRRAYPLVGIKDARSFTTGEIAPRFSGLLLFKTSVVRVDASSSTTFRETLVEDNLKEARSRDMIPWAYDAKKNLVLVTVKDQLVVRDLQMKSNLFSKKGVFGHSFVFMATAKKGSFEPDGPVVATTGVDDGTSDSGSVVVADGDRRYVPSDSRGTGRSPSKSSSRRSSLFSLGTDRSSMLSEYQQHISGANGRSRAGRSDPLIAYVDLGRPSNGRLLRTVTMDLDSDDYRCHACRSRILHYQLTHASIFILTTSELVELNPVTFSPRGFVADLNGGLFEKQRPRKPQFQLGLPYACARTGDARGRVFCDDFGLWAVHDDI